MINSITRSLLSKNAAPVYKLINDIFGMISKFETRLISHGWQEDKETGLVTHPMFFKLQQSYQAFRQCIEFLFSGMCFCCILYYLLVLQNSILFILCRKFLSSLKVLASTNPDLYENVSTSKKLIFEIQGKISPVTLLSITFCPKCKHTPHLKADEIIFLPVYRNFLFEFFLG